MSRAIGIDLGTTYSVAGIIENGRVKIIPNAEGENLTPSVYAEDASGKRMVGAIAKQKATANPENTVFSIKRHMGTDYRVPINGHSYSPQEISAFILRKIKSDAENYLHEPIQKAVITVPAYFKDAQRQATKEAGLIAGFDVMRIISEPTAAALAYGLDREDIQTILVWDLGGGTFDVSILEQGDGLFHVKAVSGNTQLGGDDWDDRLLDFLSERFLKEYGIDVKADPVIRYRLKESCEKAKRELSNKPSVKIFLPFMKASSVAHIALETTIDRKTFESITSNLREQLLAPTQQALADAKLSLKDIDRILLVGGATRMPSIRHLAEQTFQKKPYININPDEVVGVGATVQAGILSGEINNVTLVDVTPLSLGIESQGGLFAKIIHRNSTIPTSNSQIFTNARDNQTSMDINVLQGEREMAIDNVSIGQFQLTDVPPLPRGKAQVEVCFNVDVNGIVNVSAMDLYTEENTGISINATHLLSDEQLAQAVRDAEEFTQNDIKQREAVEINIRAENIIQAMDSMIEKSRGIAANNFVRKIKSAKLNLKAKIAQGEIDHINTAIQELRNLPTSNEL